MAVGLVLIIVGVALAFVTLWFWLSARADDPVLGPLEVIGDRRFKTADAEARKEMLRRARTTVEP